MEKHFLNIEYLYGDVSIQMPNVIFRTLSKEIKNKTNIQQVAFAYAFLVATTFLYRYSNYVDIDNGTYIQNADIKELLGYNKTTKTVDYIIKKNGLLDNIGLTKTIKNYPVKFITYDDIKINKISLTEFTMIDALNNSEKVRYKEIVKNRNYTVKEPLFLTEPYGDNDYGTLYSYENTHKIAIYEILNLMFDENMDIIDFLIFLYIKSKCKGYKHNMKALSIIKMVDELGIDRSTFYKHLYNLEKNDYVNVNHKGWKKRIEDIELNEYIWKGVRFKVK